jgi:hypothetical protein
MAHHTVATMLAGVIGACYIAFVIGNVVQGQPIPDGTILSVITNAIVAIGLKGYYDYVKQKREGEPEEADEPSGKD